MSTPRLFCATVLVAEAFVVFFGMLVASALTDLPQGVVLTAGLAAALACLLVAGMLGRPGAYAVGSVLQVLLVATGFVVPAMFVMGGLFAALWVTALVLARRVERIQASGAYSAGPAAGRPDTPTTQPQEESP